LRHWPPFAVVLATVCCTLPLSPAIAQGVAKDTPGTTAAGISYTVPKDWSSQVRDSAVAITAPEGDAKVVIVDVGQAKDADAAVAAAWKAYEPSMHRKVEIAQTSPGRDGWDDEREYDYTTSPNEHTVVVATALVRGGKWTVVLLVGSQATFEKRSGAANLIVASIRPASYQKENFAGKTAHRLDAARIAQLTSFVKTGMQELDVPGVAIALVDHGKVVFEGGFGVRQLGDPTPVDAHSLFMIASNTKGLTTLLLARLVDQNKLQWDEHVTDAYPPFKLGNEQTTKEVLIRDLICACTGVPRKDLDWLLNTSANTPVQSTFDQLAQTIPTSKFGEVFQYSNLMASAAGYIAGDIVNQNQPLGTSYDNAMRSLIFGPLAMNDTTFDMQKALGGNHASPHGNDVDGKTEVASMDLDMTAIAIRPAGAAWSSAHDLIKYVQDEITEGVLPNGTRLVSAKNLLQRRAHTVQVSDNIWYGMGLMDDRRWGVSVIHHGGDLIGFHSDIIAIPSAQVGAVILTNADLGGDLRDSFSRRLVELLYDGKPQAADDLAFAAKNDKDAMLRERALLTVPAEPTAASQLASRYTNAELGHIDVSHDPQGTTFNFGAWKSYMATRKNPDGTISFFTIDPGESGFEFVVSSESGKRVLIIRDGQHEYHYLEAPPN
jgi:CubicO group peptidase (beta-lactamase class C family)